MATRNLERNAVVGIFENRDDARRAVEELHRVGFTDNEIGVISHDQSGTTRNSIKDDRGTYAEEGAMTGALAGAGLGAAWAIGIAAGALPAIGPVIAGGTLAAILASAGLGAAAGGIAGTLVGMGIPEEEAEYYESEFKAGRTLVTVRDGHRYNEAASILQRHHGHVQERTGEFTRANWESRRESASAASEGHSMSDTARASGRKASRSERERQAATRASGGENIQLREEEMHVHKQPMETGEVHVHKEVKTEHKTVDVPVQREEVVIERHPVSGNAPASEEIRGDQDIRIPVKEEQVRVEKTPVVKEEIRVGKRTVQDTEHVSEDIAKEEARIERKGSAKVRDENRPNP